MSKNKYIGKVKWDRESNQMIPSDARGKLNGKAILCTRAPTEALENGQVFAAPLLWHENLVLPCVWYITSKKDLLRKCPCGAGVKRRFYLCRVIEKRYRGEENAPAHLVELIKGITRKEALAYIR